jgi:hypothetical protein
VGTVVKPVPKGFSPFSWFWLFCAWFCAGWNVLARIELIMDVEAGFVLLREFELDAWVRVALTVCTACGAAAATVGLLTAL